MRLEKNIIEEKIDHMQLSPNKVEDRTVCHQSGENVVLK